jgi:peptide/nickel transport system substrate-binding protein
LIWDRLMRIDASGLPQPYAAETVEWKDGTTVLCTLRQGLTWHDGRPLTTEDVIFSFKAPQGDMSPMYKPFVSGIRDIRAVGERQVEFSLASPNAAFETSSLAKVNLIPRHVWEPVFKDLEAKGINAETHQEDQPLGSGPFKFVNWRRSEEVVLEANPRHFEPPKMQRWILRDVPNVAAALGTLQSGELNFLSDYTGDPQLLKQAVDQNTRLTMVSTIVVGFRFLAPNQRRPPMDDPAFRRALATTVAKEQVQTNIYHGFATLADSHISKALEFWHAPNLPGYGTGDINAARKILADAGYEWDSEGRLLYPSGKQETLQPES